MKPPTAEELALQMEAVASYDELINRTKFASLVAKEFAKLHVTAALNAAAKSLPYDDRLNQDMLTQAKIAKSYPLENIK